MRYGYVENIRKQRDGLLNSEVLKPWLQQIIKLADEAVTKPVPALKMTEYLLFYETGDRKTFEDGFHARRRNCFRLAVAYWLTEDNRYLAPLIDYIGYICDEFSWCLPAHAHFFEQSVEDVTEQIDLCQAETARLLAEIVMCLEDCLPAYIKDRMAAEVQRRVVAPLMKEKVFNWHICNNNWSSVCAGSCALAIKYFASEAQQEKILPPVFAAADNYLTGICDDGCCKEGIGYWGYGFSYFCILADIIKWYGGKDYFGLEKVENLALFPQRVRLSASRCVSISDSLDTYKFSPGIMCFLKARYPRVCLPEFRYAAPPENAYSFVDILWLDPDYTADPPERESHYFADAQWYVSKHDKYSFAACGGNNGESHSHNDVGSFMITVGEDVFLADLGHGTYVKETFQLETRFNFVQNCSRGHSVPIVGGAYQCYGTEYAAKNVVGEESRFSLDIAGAYPKGQCESLHRAFDLAEDSVTLTDTVAGAALTERFISRIMPEICDGYVDYGIGRILFEPKDFAVTVGQESYLGPDGATALTVYQTDFTPKDPAKTRFTFQIQF